MTSGKYVDLQHVAGLSVLDPYGAGEGVNAGAIDAEVFGGRHAGMHLTAAGINTLESYLIAGLDAQARSQGAIPHGMRGLRG